MCDGPASCSALRAGSGRYVGSQASTNLEWDGMREQTCFQDAGGMSSRSAGRLGAWAPVGPGG